MAKPQRFRKRDSDRSGFTHEKITLVRDNGILVAPDEFDSPPPSKKSTGGEGDISPGFTRNVSDSSIATIETPAAWLPALQTITADGGISFRDRFYDSSGEELNNSNLQVVGSNQAIDISANPQITPGGGNDIFTLECVGSSVTLQDGNGLSLTAGRQFVMTSGALITFIYSSDNSVWQETSRSHRTEALGGL